PAAVPAAAAATTVPAAPAAGAAPASPAPAAPAPKLEGPGLVQPDEAVALKTDLAERLKALAAPADAADGVDPKRPVDPAAKQAAKAMQDVLQERQKRFDDYDKVVKELKDLTNPEADPDRKLAKANEELTRAKAQAAQPLQELLPEVFTQKDEIEETARKQIKDQMKEAIEERKKEVKELQDKLESTPSDPLKEVKGPLTALRAERDKIAQRLAALKARGDAPAAAPTAKTAADRKIADEKAINFRIESTVETLRSQAIELKITRANKSAEVAVADRKCWIEHLRLGRALLEKMQERFRQLAEADERKLTREAGAEQQKAERTEDPLNRYLAGRNAELLELEASAVKFEQLATAGSTPSLESQRTLAVRAGISLAKIKALLDDGSFSPSDLILLNTDYRRIGPEREKLRRNELAAVERLVRDYANALTSAELELIEDSLLDQVERENLLDALPPARHAKAEAEVAKLEVKHRALLERRRDALRDLYGGVSETLDQINRRLDLLDEEYTFIRTHLFWIRDQDPINLATIGRGAGELQRLAKVSFGLAKETTTPKSWRRLTPEFLATGLLALVLPLGIFRLRGVLKQRLLHALPPARLHGDSARSTVKVDMNPVVQQS
ncbi:MAG: hypothetical protein P4L85_08580, partial [Paludisphaera borealis]|nr:hypothetical protein [Paludisphaera borealis]